MVDCISKSCSGGLTAITILLPMLRTTSYKLVLTANCSMLHLMLHAHTYYFFTVNACLCHIPQVVAPQTVCSFVADNPLKKRTHTTTIRFHPLKKHIRIKHIRVSPQQLSRISASHRQAIAWPYIYRALLVRGQPLKPNTIQSGLHRSTALRTTASKRPRT